MKIGDSAPEPFYEKSKLEAILQSIGDGLFVTDREGKITMVNKAFEILLGWSAKEVLGKDIEEINMKIDESGNTIPYKETILSRVLEGEKFVPKIPNNYSLTRKDGSSFAASIVVTPIYLDQKIVGSVEVFRDITREKEIDKAKSEFIGIASHQLRTPLGIIKWYIESIKTNNYIHKAPDKALDYINEIDKSNERLLEIVRNLLTVAHIEEKRTKNNPRLINIFQTIQEIINEMKIEASKKSISVYCEFPKDSVSSVTIDDLQLKEVIENLISNAIKYSREKGEIVVGIKVENEMVKISIKDRGIGIPTHAAESIFTRFFRADNALKTKSQGTGLGLYVVKSFVEGWGGKIWYDSEVNKGTTFFLTIPLKIKSKHT